MNFEFSDEQKFIQNQAREFLQKECTPEQVRTVLDSDEPYHRDLWKSIVELGWTATTIPEEYGGLGLGYLELCVIAEELGRSLAPVPFSSSVYLATETMLLAGSDSQREKYLPQLAAGEVIGTAALVEQNGSCLAANMQCRFDGSSISGSKTAVPDATVADLAVVAGREDGVEGFSLFLVDLRDDGVTRHTQESMDSSRPVGELIFSEVAVERLGLPGEGEYLVAQLFDRVAVLLAFEQIGGAQATIDMACEYTKARYAFGRQVASFQAIKHKLANMFVDNELAKANAYYGAWALSTAAPELPLAAATARVSAIDAYFHCSKENIQAHGGMGFTWEFNCHLYYRRAQSLALLLGGQRIWKNLLVDRLQQQTAA